MDNEIQKYLEKKVRFSEAGELYQGLLDESVPSTRSLVQRWEVYQIKPRNIKNKTILDLGCNIGGFSALVQKRCKSYLGIDKDRDSIKLAKHLYKYPNCIFRAQSILNFPESHYDVVFAFAVRYYTKLSMEDFVAKLASFLCPGGTLFYESHGKKKMKEQSAVWETLFSIKRVLPILTVNNGKRPDYRFFAEMIKK